MPAGEYGCDCDYPAPSGYSGVNCDEDYHECFYEPCGELYAGKGTQKGVCRDSHSNTLYDAGHCTEVDNGTCAMFVPVRHTTVADELSRWSAHSHRWRCVLGGGVPLRLQALLHPGAGRSHAAERRGWGDVQWVRVVQPPLLADAGVHRRRGHDRPRVVVLLVEAGQQGLACRLL